MLLSNKETKPKSVNSGNLIYAAKDGIWAYYYHHHHHYWWEGEGRGGEGLQLLSLQELSMQSFQPTPVCSVLM